MEDKELHNKRYEEQLEIVSGMRLLDDDLMKAVFAHDKRAVEVVLQIIMEKPDLEVVSVKVEDDLHNLFGHSVRLDVHAVDAEGQHYDIEIQRADKGAGTRRARYNMGILDSSLLARGEQYDELPESYVIFITEHDVFGHGSPLYHIERIIMELNELFDDGGHIIYVNGEYRGNDDIGKLMSDFRARSADEIHYPELAEPVRHFKETEKGASDMCKTVEDYAEKRAAEAAVATLARAASEVAKKTGRSFEDALDLLGASGDEKAEVRALAAERYA